MFEIHIGPVPDDKQIDHTCRVRACVNPKHMEPVTQRVNILRGVAPPAENARKTVCSKGHPFSEANTYRNPRGHRICRLCRNASSGAAHKRARLRERDIGEMARDPAEGDRT